MPEGSLPGESEQAFQLLEREALAGVGVLVRDTDLVLDAGPVAHAVDRPGRRHLLVPVSEEQGHIDDTSSRGVTLRTHRLVDRGKERLYVDATCMLPELRDLFAVVCDELLGRLRITPERPVQTCALVLDRWRELLSPSSGTLLGPQQLAGLLAELHTLERLVGLDPSAAVGTWTGPDRSRFDFTGPSVAVEVKATTLRERLDVEIHGVTQLDPPAGMTLALRVERLEAVPTGEDSVPDAVQRLLNLVADRVLLVKGLSDSGYLMGDVETYQRVRFRTLEERWFLVDPAFPGITTSSFVDPGRLGRVTRLRYNLDLTAAPPFPLTDEVVHGLLRGLLTPTCSHL